jgi:hypothetical protein
MAVLTYHAGRFDVDWEKALYHILKDGEVDFSSSSVIVLKIPSFVDHDGDGDLEDIELTLFSDGPNNLTTAGDAITGGSVTDFRLQVGGLDVFDMALDTPINATIFESR